MSIPSEDVRGWHLLVKEEAWALQVLETVLVHIMLEDATTATGLCHTGAIFLGKKCRVSRYQSRKHHKYRSLQDPPSNH